MTHFGFPTDIKVMLKNIIQERNTNRNGLKSSILSMACQTTSTEAYSSFADFEDKC